MLMALYCTHCYVTYFVSLLRFRCAFINLIFINLFSNYFTVWVTMIYSLVGIFRLFPILLLLQTMIQFDWISHISISWMARSKEINPFFYWILLNCSPKQLSQIKCLPVVGDNFHCVKSHQHLVLSDLSNFSNLIGMIHIISCFNLPISS